MLRTDLVQRALLAVAMLATPILALSQSRKAGDAEFTPMVLIDLVPAVDESPVATRVFSFTAEDDDPAVVQLFSMIRSLSSADSIGGAARVLRFVRERGQQLSTNSSNRWVSHQGDSIDVIVLRPAGAQPDMEVEEKARESHLSANLDSLIDLSGSLANRSETRNARRVISFTRRKYRLRNTRGALRIDASLTPVGKKGDEKDESDEAKGGDSQQPVSTTLITGPSERVFLSGNAAFTKVRQVRYNPDDQSFIPGNKPTEFLIGVNYSLQDMFRNDNASGWRAFGRGVYLGFLAEPSKRPFNQIGGVVGFRHSPPPFETLFSLETVSPYFGLVWARDDVPAEGGPSPVKTRYGKRALIMGLALGLDRALGWIAGTQ
jgi:hypothetical protein